MTDLSFAPLHQLAALIAKGELSPVDLTDHFLQRIERFDGRLGAYMTVTADRARAVARAAQEALAGGHRYGPLHGIPLAVKDLIDVAGLSTTGGSLLFKDRLATADATVWRCLAGAGAVLLGKTHMVEFAYGGVGINHHYGTPHNPWDAATQRIPGGSSSGSGVAVGAGLAPAALGSDTGGSVRIPASFCGLVGLKPTFGRVSNAGVLPLDPTLDSVGPMVRCTRDAALLFEVLAGPDAADATTWSQPCGSALERLAEGAAGLRLAIPQEYFWDDADPEVVQAVRATAAVFGDLGAYVEEVSLPELDELTRLRAMGSLTAVETYLYFRSHLEKEPERFDPIVAERMLAGGQMAAVDYLKALRGYEALKRRFGECMQTFDALLTPTTPFAALPVAEVDTAEHYARINGLCLRNTSAANLLGLCAVSLPCGFTAGGLPIGLHLVGRPWEEGLVLRLAHAYEQATQWHLRRPPVEDFAV